MLRTRILLAVLPGLLLGGMANLAIASEAEIEEITVIGSRAPGRSAEDIPVPVDVLTSDMLEETGQTEVGRMLQAIAPSFNFSSSSISDGTDALRPATLRGLGPDQTLVLINGKRRHQSALVHINTSVGRGTAGTDMNAIPAASIKRIEVLRDGAAAQYGSDAIAGVINIVLNDYDEGGKVSVTTGETSENDGATTNVDITKGFALGSSGFLNASVNYRDRDYTNRAGLHGSCQFPGCTSLGGGVYLAGDPREATAPRDTFRIGDAESQQLGVTLNGAFELGAGELYGFVTYSSRDNESAAFFRDNANSSGNSPLADGDATIPAGFLPLIYSEIKDVSLNFGYRTDFDDGSTLDLSYTDGTNTTDYDTNDSINSSFANQQRYTTSLTSDEIRASVPRTAYAYGLELGLQTINLDHTRSYDNLFVAMGLELREDEYKIIAGEEYAYRDYDTVNGVSLYPDDRSGGIQGFPGIAPKSEVSETRDVISFYVDSEYQATDSLMVSGALRYDDYDGFGDTTNFKIAGSYRVNDFISLRSAISTGFRAPSMQQLYFNNLGTQFVSVNGALVAQEVGTFRNDSTLAQAIGIPALKEEKSTNWSVGFITNPLDNLSITVDYYSIDIEDRIVISNRLGSGLSPVLDAALVAAGAGSGQFFLNGADTETQGVDLVATWGTDLFEGNLDLTLAANFTKTEVVDLFTPNGTGLTTDQVFSEQDISIIEEWQPEDRISLSGVYRQGPLTVNLALNRYGEYTVLDGARQTYGAKILTDARVAYEVMEGLSLSLGANNLFDVTPDKNKVGNSRSGTIVDDAGNTIVSSPGIFTYSRRSAPFGFNGAYYYAGVSYSF
jgi:iron complex outermembrane receptor protein